MEEVQAQTKQPPHILLVPYPAHGHIVPLLDLAHLLSLQNLSLTIVVTPSDLPLLTPLLSKSPSIQTLSLPFPSNNANLKFDVLMHALTGLHDPLLSWIQTQSSQPVTAIISDFFHGWTQALADKLRIPRIVFCPSGVVATAVLHSLFRRMPQRPDPADDEYVISFPAVPNSPSFAWRKLSRLYRDYEEGNQVSEAVKQNFLFNLKSCGMITNSFKAMEAAYMDYPLEDLGFQKVWAVGPLAPREGEKDRGGANTVSSADVTTWLDRFPVGSVVYISFGSQVILGPAQAAALATALEISGVQFIWAMHESTIIPDGFVERMGHKGMVIKGWAPQVSILLNRAVGWFLTHCGWNSILEATAAGVSLLTWPMTADQYTNEKLIVEELGIAMSAWEGFAVPEEDALVRVLAEAVGERGNVIRERSEELQRMAAEAVREGGCSRKDLEELVQELWKMKAREGKMC